MHLIQKFFLLDIFEQLLKLIEDIDSGDVLKLATLILAAGGWMLWRPPRGSLKPAIIFLSFGVIFLGLGIWGLNLSGGSTNTILNEVYIKFNDGNYNQPYLFDVKIYDKNGDEIAHKEITYLESNLPAPIQPGIWESKDCKLQLKSNKLNDYKNATIKMLNKSSVPNQYLGFQIKLLYRFKNNSQLYGWPGINKYTSTYSAINNGDSIVIENVSFENP